MYTAGRGLDVYMGAEIIIDQLLCTFRLASLPFLALVVLIPTFINAHPPNDRSRHGRAHKPTAPGDRSVRTRYRIKAPDDNGNYTSIKIAVVPLLGTNVSRARTDWTRQPRLTAYVQCSRYEDLCSTYARQPRPMAPLCPIMKAASFGGGRGALHQNFTATPASPRGRPTNTTLSPGPCPLALCRMHR